MTQPLKLNYTILSKDPHVLIKFFYEGENGEYAEFKMELRKLNPKSYDVNRPQDSLAVNGTAELFSNNPDGALDLVAAFAKAIKTEEPNTQDKNSCPKCGCLYDDKQTGAQGRNGNCECDCKHHSPDWRGNA